MSKPRAIIAIAVVGGLVAGYAASSWLHRSRPDRPAAGRAPAASESGDADRTGSVEAEIAALRAALDEERGRRAALEMEIDMLRQQTAPEALSGGESATAAAGARKPGSAKAGEGAAGAATASQPAPGGKEWFDEADLVDRGVDERRAAWLRERFEQLQMDELYLRDEAFRQGWLGRPRYHKQLQDLYAATRQELGDDDYDLLLYASGRDNRVRLSDVLQNSPAAAGGIEPGDIVVRYDGQAIFTGSDLIGATRQGSPGSTVPVDVLRNGQPRRVYVEQGPLGVRIRSLRLFPGAGR
jgi:hypothetical protein